MKRWMLAAVLLATGCNSAPSEDQCTQLLARLVDLEFKKGGATATDSMKAEIVKQKQTVIESKAADFLEACTKKTTKVRVECALAVSDLEALAQCDENK
jgi:hypothetical protein